jgi:uncharacterized protein (TIGR02145 family)
MYQWGRKDPFMGASTFTSKTLALSTGTWSTASGGSVALAEANPMTFYTNTDLPNGSWQSEKTAYDPCPAGWRVPDGGENGVWAKAMMKTESFTNGLLKAEKGLNFSNTMGDDETIYYPISGYRSSGNGALVSVSSSGYYWSYSHVPNYSSNAYNFYLNDWECNPFYSYYRSAGMLVRCQKII